MLPLNVACQALAMRGDCRTLEELQSRTACRKLAGVAALILLLAQLS